MFLEDPFQIPQIFCIYCLYGTNILWVSISVLYQGKSHVLIFARHAKQRYSERRIRWGLHGRSLGIKLHIKPLFVGYGSWAPCFHGVQRDERDRAPLITSRIRRRKCRRRDGYCENPKYRPFFDHHLSRYDVENPLAELHVGP